MSQPLISRIELGQGDRLTARTLERVAAARGARVTVRLDYNGEARDRLLDADHATLVEAVIGVLAGAGWTCVPEVTFAIDGERGSVDVLAWHGPTRMVLVVEVKTVVPDLQATLATLDRKARLGRRIARQQGWEAAAVGCLLVIADGRTARRRVAEHGATFASTLPDRSVVIRRALRDPDPARPLRGLWFLPRMPQAHARHRVAGRPGGRRAW